MERIHSLSLSFRLEDPFCAFGAALLQKGLLMERIHSLSLSFRLEDPSCAFDAPLLQEPAANSPQKEKSQLSLTLFRDRVSSREADIGHCFFLPPR